MSISFLPGSMNSFGLPRRVATLALDGIFFHTLVEGIHPKSAFRTPGRSLIFQGILVGPDGPQHRNLRRNSPIFLFLPPGFFLLRFAVFGPVSPAQYHPDLRAHYRCWGYPWVPARVGSSACALALTVNIWIDRPCGRSSIGLLLEFSPTSLLSVRLASLPFQRAGNPPGIRASLKETVLASQPPC